MINRLDTAAGQTFAIVKTVIAASVSWELAQMSGSTRPYLAPVAVVLCLHATLDDSFLHGFRRIIGTLLGAIPTVFLGPYLGNHAWSIGLVVLIGMGIARIFSLSSEVGHIAAVNALLILAFQSSIGGYAFDRIWDTIIGVFVALAANGCEMLLNQGHYKM